MKGDLLCSARGVRVCMTYMYKKAFLSIALRCSPSLPIDGVEEEPILSRANNETPPPTPHQQRTARSDLAACLHAQRTLCASLARVGYVCTPDPAPSSRVEGKSIPFCP